MKNSPQYNKQAEPEQLKSKVEEMYLTKPGNWPDKSENTDAMIENPFVETKSQSSQIKQKYEIIKLLNGEVMINDAQQKHI